MTINISDWMASTSSCQKSTTKYRGYQNAGHKEKVVKNRHSKNKLAKKARKKNR